MIGYLEGEIQHKLKGGVLLHTSGGVGYEVNLPLPLLADAGEAGTAAQYYITSVFNKDSGSALYGFADIGGKHLFEMLISVSGIGPKAGLAFLSAFAPEGLARAIVQQDVALLSTIPGIGKKTASRLCIELSDKLGKADGLPEANNGTRGELLSALTNLGFQEKDVVSVLRQLPSDSEDFSEQLKQALAMLGRN